MKGHFYICETREEANKMVAKLKEMESSIGIRHSIIEATYRANGEKKQLFIIDRYRIN